MTPDAEATSHSAPLSKRQSSGQLATTSKDDNQLYFSPRDDGACVFCRRASSASASGATSNNNEPSQQPCARAFHLPFCKLCERSNSDSVVFKSYRDGVLGANKQGVVPMVMMRRRSSTDDEDVDEHGDVLAARARYLEGDEEDKVERDVVGHLRVDRLEVASDNQSSSYESDVSTVSAASSSPSAAELRGSDHS
jgi:hypothetical protein